MRRACFDCCSGMVAGGRGSRLQVDSVPSNRAALSSADCVRPRVFMGEHFAIDPWFPTLVRRWFGVSVGTSEEWSLFYTS